MFFDFSIDQKVEWEIEEKYVETDLIPWLIETTFTRSEQTTWSFVTKHFMISEWVDGFREQDKKHELKMKKPLISPIPYLE